MKKINVKAVALKVVGNVAGATAGAALNKVKFIGDKKPVIRGGIKLALGALLPHFAKAKPGSVVEAAGAGMCAIGGLEIINSFIKDETKKLSISGIGDIETLAGLGNIGATLDFTEDYQVQGVGTTSENVEIDL